MQPPMQLVLKYNNFNFKTLSNFLLVHSWLWYSYKLLAPAITNVSEINPGNQTNGRVLNYGAFIYKSLKVKFL